MELKRHNVEQMARAYLMYELAKRGSKSRSQTVDSPHTICLL